MVEYTFHFEVYCPTQSYPAGTLFYVNIVGTSAAELDQLRNRGFKIIYDNLWEQHAGAVDGALVLHNPAWFWYNEALWYHHLNYAKHVPDRTYQYQALMPMNLKKPHRDRLITQLGSTLDRMIWSYVAQGRQLPWDRDMNDWDTQRYVNPEWYNQSYCSIVAETAVEPNPYQSVFITEKTFKPIAFKHPFLVYGHQHSLRTLHDLGFATWDNLWDESYDSIQDPVQRCSAIVNIVKNIQVIPYDSETRYRLNHNADRFFDRVLVEQRIRTEIIDPIIHYAETH